LTRDRGRSNFCIPRACPISRSFENLTGMRS
jgi:hypothetical protein